MQGTPALLLNGEASHGLIVLLLRVGQRQFGIDLQRLPTLMARVRLDEGVIDALLFQPGEEKMPPFVRGHGTGNPSRLRIARQHFPDPAISVFVLAGRLEE
ncbi:MAG TPA: hypothetical protein VF026_32810 [Ktedonobacteraceae bacterium]